MSDSSDQLVKFKMDTPIKQSLIYYEFILYFYLISITMLLKIKKVINYFSKQFKLELRLQNKISTTYIIKKQSYFVYFH